MHHDGSPCLGRGFCTHAAFTSAGSCTLIALPFAGANPRLQCTTTYGASCVKCDSSNCLDCGEDKTYYYDATAKSCKAVSQGRSVRQAGCASRIVVLQCCSAVLPPLGGPHMHACCSGAGGPVERTVVCWANPLLQCIDTYGANCATCDEARCLDCGEDEKQYYDATTKRCEAVSQG